MAKEWKVLALQLADRAYVYVSGNAVLETRFKGLAGNKPFQEASYILASLRYSSVTMLQPISCGIQSHVGGLLPIRSGTEFEMCRQISRGLGEYGLRL